jgi:hypothetical protein
MAINKAYRDSRGVKTLYHKISEYKADGKTVSVTLFSFVNASYRDKEKKAAERTIKLDAMQKELDDLMAANSDDSFTEKIQKLTDEYNALFFAGEPVEELHAYEMTLTLPYTEPLSLSAIYEAIADGDSELAGGVEI